MRCVLRPEDASKCVCGRGSAREPTSPTAYSAPPDLPAGFGERKWERSNERARDGKGTEGERKEGERKEEGRGMEGNGI